MVKGDDIPKTDPAEIERLIERPKQSNLDPRDLDLVEQLLRMTLRQDRQNSGPSRQQHLCILFSSPLPSLPPRYDLKEQNYEKGK